MVTLTWDIGCLAFRWLGFTDRSGHRSCASEHRANALDGKVQPARDVAVRGHEPARARRLGIEVRRQLRAVGAERLHLGGERLLATVGIAAIRRAVAASIVLLSVAVSSSAIAVARCGPILTLSPDTAMHRCACTPRTGRRSAAPAIVPPHILWICRDQLKSAKHLRAEISASVSPRSR